MSQHQKTPDRTVKTLAMALICLGVLFSITGCTQIYKLIGLTEEQTNEQVDLDRQVITRTITEVRTQAADLITTAVAAAGTIASGLLATWLGRERKITKALIVGIENSPELDTKKNVRNAAISAGVEKALHKRVEALT